MKQKIIKKQWDELSNWEIKEKAYKIFTKLNCDEFDYGRDEDNMCDFGCLPNIGQMVEFLGDDLDRIEFNMWGGDDFDDCRVRLDEYKEFNNKDLCDSLWEAVKYKLLKHL